MVLFLFLGLQRFATPSLWHDEFILVMSTELDWAALAERYMLVDYHPPYYALLLKLLSGPASADWVFRLPSLLASVACLLTILRMARPWGSWAAASFALLTGVNFWFVLFARQARPYALAVWLTTYCLLALARAIKEAKPAHWTCYLALAGLLLTHYAFALAAAAMMASLCAWRWFKPCPASRGTFLGSLAACAAGIGLILPYYLNTADIWTKDRSFADRLERLAYNTVSLFTGLEYSARQVRDAPWELVLPGIILAGLAWLFIRGTVRLARSNPGVLGLVLAVIGLPVLYVTVPVNQYGEFQPWHLSPLLPAVLFLAAIGAGVSWRNLLVALLVAGACLGQFASLNYIFSTESGTKGLAKHLARQACETSGPPVYLAVTNDLTWQFMNWYMQRLCPAGHSLAPPLGQGEQSARLVFISGAGVLPDGPDSLDQDIASRFPPGSLMAEERIPSQGAIGHGNEFHLLRYEAETRREPGLELAPRSSMEIGNDPLEVLKRVDRLENMAIKPSLIPCEGSPGCWYVFPSTPGKPGVMTFTLRLPHDGSLGPLRVSARFFLRTDGYAILTLLSPDGRELAADSAEGPALEERTIQAEIPAAGLQAITVRIELLGGSEPSPIVLNNTLAGFLSLTADLR